MTAVEDGQGFWPRFFIGMVSITAATIMFLRTNYAPVEPVFLVLTGFLAITGFAALVGFVRGMIEEIQVHDALSEYVKMHEIEIRDNQSNNYDLTACFNLSP
jgi:hypothetical protein